MKTFKEYLEENNLDLKQLNLFTGEVDKPVEGKIEQKCQRCLKDFMSHIHSDVCDTCYHREIADIDSCVERLCYDKE